jgi:diaminohydroxyphosphoribosylaminopyrimidine deaminase / 5-amino-6-(5-phosphoribosylamino)uracil reductase
MSEKQLEFYLKKTFELAKKGAGYVSPNPMVGAVLVKNKKIIGEGYHERFGQVHAEVNAVENATESVDGATLYCNLEPCCHLDKKTSPCAQRIIKEGIKKVVISNLDPNPQVSGNGLRLLKESGIEVISGVLKEEGEKLNRFFFKYIKKKIPYVTIKIAQTLDGKISEAKGKQSWITCEESVKLVHKWRSEYDAVLVGAGTAIIDNPELTVHNNQGRDPIRIIVDGKLNVSPDLKVFNNKNPEKTIIVTTPSAYLKKSKAFESKSIHVLKINTKYDKINLNDILSEIGKMDIASILVEGGSQIFSQFISEKLFDELKIFISPKFFTNGEPALKNSSLENINLSLSEIEKIGTDVLLTYRPK